MWNGAIKNVSIVGTESYNTPWVSKIVQVVYGANASRTRKRFRPDRLATADPAW